MALHAGKQLGFSAAAIEDKQSVEGIDGEMSSASQVCFFGIIPPAMKPEDGSMMTMSNPPNESVARVMQARIETAAIAVLTLMEPP
jgi:hypothetical protein